MEAGSNTTEKELTVVTDYDYKQMIEDICDIVEKHKSDYDLTCGSGSTAKRNIVKTISSLCRSRASYIEAAKDEVRNEN
jgi:predicted RNase H-related nuclease YkuK (DUF458 family)